MNETAAIFKPSVVSITLGDKEYTLKYDMNAFCELEKFYDSIDSIIQMLLGTGSEVNLGNVAYNGITIAPDDITIDKIPMSSFMKAQNQIKTAKHADTLRLLWAGTLHDHAIFDEYGEITGYTISRAELGKYIGFANLREVNNKIATAILQDLIPIITEETKKVQAQGSPAQGQAPVIQLKTE
jgi:hypothetical protein